MYSEKDQGTMNEKEKDGNERRINTEGGAYIEGNVDTGGGDFVGRDQTKGQTTVDAGTTNIHGDAVAGDKITLSGDFRGAIVNVKSRLDGVTQTINASPHGDEQQKAELVTLVQELKRQLDQIPPARLQEVQKLSRYAETLAEELAEEEVDKELVEKQGSRLKKAAEELQDVLPSAITIATQIVSAALTLVSG